RRRGPARELGWGHVARRVRRQLGIHARARDLLVGDESRARRRTTRRSARPRRRRRVAQPERDRTLLAGDPDRALPPAPRRAPALRETDDAAVAGLARHLLLLAAWPRRGGGNLAGRTGRGGRPRARRHRARRRRSQGAHAARVLRTAVGAPRG